MAWDFSSFPPYLKLSALGAPSWIHPEPRTEAIEQFLASLRFEQRDKLADLPFDLIRDKVSWYCECVK
jgi:hypothetical protein